MARITPLEKPYPPAFEAQMKGLMRGADPLVLFTTLATNERAWSKFTGGSLLDKASPLSPRQRELVIDRTTAKCGCEYEWGVHVAAFASHVGIDAEQARALGGIPHRIVRTAVDERVLLAAVDALLDTRKLSDDQWTALSAHFDEAQAIEIVQLVAFYHGVSLICGALDLPLESNAARFPAASGD